MNHFFAKVILFMMALWTLSGCAPSAASNTASPAPTQLPAANSPNPIIQTDTLPPPEPTQTVLLPEPLAPTLEPQVNEGPRLLRIAMIDEHNGWGLGEGQVLRTTDGGAQWQDATPPGAAGTAGGSFFLDASKGWVLFPDPADFNKGTLYITSDGGQSWEATVTPFGGGYLQFLDAQSGMALIVTGAAAGSAPADLYRPRIKGGPGRNSTGLTPRKRTRTGCPSAG